MHHDHVFTIAEIGINHNGKVQLAKTLIDAAALAGADAVKFQKRTLEKVYTKEELDKYRESLWGTTNREQKAGLEFGVDEFKEIDAYCKEKDIHWFASAWDLESQKFLQQFDLNYNKIASSRIGHSELLNMVADEGKYTFISTGMSDLEEIENAVKVFKDKGCPFEIMHCTSTYPTNVEELNLACIPVLREKFGCDVGFSGHETGIATSVAAVALGATSVERHLTLDRAMYGSDQAASVEPHGFMKLVRDIRAIETAMGDGNKNIWDSERPIIEKLKRSVDL